jgi:hypothetical protein
MELAKVRSVFEGNDVRKALLIDDAFDTQVPDYEFSDLEAAFGLIEEEDEYAAAWQRMGGARVPIGAADMAKELESNPALVSELQKSLSEGTAFENRLARSIYGSSWEDLRGRLEPLERLQAILGELGVECVSVGSDIKAAELDKFPLIFLDYYLGKKGAPSIKKSQEMIMGIISGYSTDERPVVVLMSSELNKEKQVSEFRENAELLGCQFRFVKKDEITSRQVEFASLLLDLVSYLPQARIIGGFVESWKNSLTYAVTDFVDEIGKLDLLDYFYAKDKLAASAKLRFGDHISALFNGYLRKLTEDRPELKIATSRMNGLNFDQQPPSPFMPSQIVAKLAHASTFQDFSDNLDSSVSGSQPQTVELGDIYFRETRKTGGKTVREVLCVISQACDLQQGNAESVLLINGTLSKRGSNKRAQSGEKSIALRIDIFQHEKQDYIVEWDARRLATIPAASFFKEMESRSFERVARLRPLHALALQQKFSAHLTRVGLPETLPAYRYASVEVLVKVGNTNKKILEVGSMPGHMACVVGDEKYCVIFLDALFSEIRVALDNESAKVPGSLVLLRQYFSDVVSLRELRSIELKGSKALRGIVGIHDTGALWETSKNFGKGEEMVINLF